MQPLYAFNAQNRIQTGKYRGKEWRKWDQEMAQATLKLVSPTRAPRVTNMPPFATATFPRSPAMDRLKSTDLFKALDKSSCLFKFTTCAILL